MIKNVISIAGLPGSGKTETINYLMKKLNWPKVYFGEVTFDEMKRLGLEINEKNEKIAREGLREKFGKLVYAEQIIKKIEDADYDNVLVESLYSWQEYLAFKEKFKEKFITIAIYSSPKKRYERLGKREIRPLTPEDAQSRDYAQIKNTEQAGPIAMADYTIINEEDGVENIYSKLDLIIELILNK
jgi:dephospho-CoA kinase